jgi:hypothetical protein
MKDQIGCCTVYEKTDMKEMAFPSLAEPLENVEGFLLQKPNTVDGKKGKYGQDGL